MADTALLTLHAVRLQGMTTEGAIAARFGLDRSHVAEHLLDFQAYGWVGYSSFAGEGGWSLTPAGRAHDEQLLARELGDRRPQVEQCYEQFLELNGRFQTTVTKWQIRPLPGAPLAANDHTDFRWDDRVIDELAGLGARLRPVVADVAAVLPRFSGYSDRYDGALARVHNGQRSWVDGVGKDSLHRIWFELHEDFIATLGVER